MIIYKMCEIPTKEQQIYAIAKKQAKILFEEFKLTTMTDQITLETQKALWEEVEEYYKEGCTYVCMDVIYKYGYIDGLKARQ